jgi:hypothetical protein
MPSISTFGGNGRGYSIGLNVWSRPHQTSRRMSGFWSRHCIAGPSQIHSSPQFSSCPSMRRPEIMRRRYVVLLRKKMDLKGWVRTFSHWEKVPNEMRRMRGYDRTQVVCLVTPHPGPPGRPSPTGRGFAHKLSDAVEVGRGLIGLPGSPHLPHCATIWP